MNNPIPVRSSLRIMRNHQHSLTKLLLNVAAFSTPPASLSCPGSQLVRRPKRRGLLINAQAKPRVAARRLTIPDDELTLLQPQQSIILLKIRLVITAIAGVSTATSIFVCASSVGNKLTS
jgi:hypothetical protein